MVAGPLLLGEEKGDGEGAEEAEGKGEGRGERDVVKERRKRRSGVSDGLGGVVFGGDTEEFREAEAAAAAMERARRESVAAAAAADGAGMASNPCLQDVAL